MKSEAATAAQEPRYCVVTAFDIRRSRSCPVLLLNGDLCVSALRFTTLGRMAGRHFKVQRRALHALGLYFVFSASLSRLRERDQPKTIERRLQQFEQAFRNGTINRKGRDKMGLFWRPAASDLVVETMVSHLASYLHYLAQVEDALLDLDENEKNWVLRLRREMAHSRQRSGWSSSYDFLRHVAEGSGRELSRFSIKDFRRFAALPAGMAGQRQPTALPRFPSDRLWDLVFEGCMRPGVPPNAPYERRFNIRDQLLIMLLGFSGSRGSETLLLFATDLIPVYEPFPHLHVRLAHPELGVEMDERGHKVTRAQLLFNRWGLLPRTRLADKHHCGWKNLGLDNAALMSTSAYLLLDRGGHSFLLRLFSAYLEIRHRLVAACPYKHPYLFVTADGTPMTSDALRDVWQRACKRIGLTGLREDGQHPHSARHTFVDAMESLDFPDGLIMQVLHHKSIQSQDAYKVKPASVVQSTITHAWQTVLRGEATAKNISKSEVKSGMDPGGYFSKFLDSL